MIKMIKFNPYDYARYLGAIELTGAINWTRVTFADEATRRKFDTECRNNGYRVRDFGPCKTQYHHYQD